MNTKTPPGKMPELAENERWFRCESLERALGIIQGLEHLERTPTYTLKKFQGSRKTTRSIPERRILGSRWHDVSYTEHEVWWEIVAHKEVGS